MPLIKVSTLVLVGMARSLTKMVGRCLLRVPGMDLEPGPCSK